MADKEPTGWMQFHLSARRLNEALDWHRGQEQEKKEGDADAHVP